MYATRNTVECKLYARFGERNRFAFYRYREHSVHARIGSIFAIFVISFLPCRKKKKKRIRSFFPRSHSLKYDISVPGRHISRNQSYGDCVVCAVSDTESDRGGHWRQNSSERHALQLQIHRTSGIITNCKYKHHRQTLCSKPVSESNGVARSYAATSVMEQGTTQHKCVCVYTSVYVRFV